MDFKTPISFVLSYTVITIVFITPIPPTMIARPEIAREAVFNMPVTSSNIEDISSLVNVERLLFLSLISLLTIVSLVLSEVLTKIDETLSVSEIF